MAKMWKKQTEEASNAIDGDAADGLQYCIDCSKYVHRQNFNSHFAVKLRLTSCPVDSHSSAIFILSILMKLELFISSV